jgi:hypothetical protein
MHRVHFGVQLRLTLGSRISNRNQPVTNKNLFERLARVDNLASSDLHSSPLAALQSEGLIRGDVSYMFTKTIAGAPRQLVIDYEGPWNLAQRDIDLLLMMRSGYANAPFEFEHIKDFRGFVVDFYRDIILRRFFEDLFFDIEVLPRL